ncbi:MAG TPA: transcription termination factor Rho [Acidimicrobiia bacterium]|nr:transcription termination factor Rho [Acidimicrobiia bacterium]
MSTRAQLQTKSIAELRQIAEAVGVESDGLQKSKLISALMAAGGVTDDGEEASMVDLPTATPRNEESRSSEFSSSKRPSDRTNSPDHGDEIQSNEVSSDPQGDRDGEGDSDSDSDSDSDEGSSVIDTSDSSEGGPDDRDDFRGNRRRRRRGRGGGPAGGREPREYQGTYEPVAEGDLETREGLLDILPEGYGFLRTDGYLPGDRDVYVSAGQVRKFGLRRADLVVGPVRPARAQEKFPALIRIDTVNGMTADEAMRRPRFEHLTPLFPDQRLRLEIEGKGNGVLTRIVDLIAPIGKGQRGLIVSPPKAGKTTVLQEIAQSIAANNPECYLMVVLVDERPEEVTDMQRSVKGEVIYSTFDRPAEESIQVSELAIERAKRLVEMGTDVVILLDSITRLARAHNLATPASGRILSGGVDSTALYPPKRFFGAARNIEEGGSLTILGTALVETGSKMDEVIFEEFKGTGNMELRLDRKLADRRIYPAIDVESSGTRREELLFDRKELAQVWKLRRVLLALESGASLELLIDRLKNSNSNEEFLADVAKSGN